MPVSADLKARLAAIVGPRHLVSEPADLRPFAEDIRGYVRGAAELAVLPADTGEAAEVLRALAAAGEGFVPQGGNTGLCAGAVPVAPARVVVGLRRLDRIESVDADGRVMIAGAGVTLQAAREAAAAAGCLLPLSIGSEGSCQLGGTVATNAGGHNVLRYGTMRGLVLGLEVVLPDGRVWNGLRTLRKDNTGYDLKQLFIGAEGTLGLITRVALALAPAEARVETALAAVPDPAAAVALLRRAQAAAAGLVSAFEYLGGPAVAAALAQVPAASLPLAGAPGHLVLIELGLPAALPPGLSLIEELLGPALEDGLVDDAVLAAGAGQRAGLWRLREAVVEGLRREGGLVAHDVTLPIAAIPAFLAEAGAALAARFPGCRPAPFGHLGDGNLHYNVQYPAGGDAAAFLSRRAEVNRIIYDLVAAMGGSFSAEHGVGLLKREEMVRYKDPVELDLMARIKAALDPEGRANPGKVLPGPALSHPPG